MIRQISVHGDRDVGRAGGGQREQDKLGQIYEKSRKLKSMREREIQELMEQQV